MCWAGAAVRVWISLLLGVLDGELDGAVDCVNILEEAVQLLCDPS